MKIKRVDHVAVMASDVSAAKRLYGAVLGLPMQHEEVYRDDDLLTFYAAGDTQIELCTPKGDESETAEALRRRGGGHIDHVALEVEDIDEATRELAAMGVSLRPPGIEAGAGGSRVAVLCQAATGGVQIELVEKPQTPGRRRSSAG